MKTQRTTEVHMQRVIDAVIAERERQDRKFGWIGSDATILPGDDDWQKYAVLGEEFGEVGRALLERAIGKDTTEHVEEELIQCAAVCVAWVEAAREKRVKEAAKLNRLREAFPDLTAHRLSVNDGAAHIERIEPDNERTWYGD